MMATIDETTKQLHYLAGALKAPRILEVATRLADQARDAGWSFRVPGQVLDRHPSRTSARISTTIDGPAST